MHRVCVFAASRDGTSGAFLDVARSTGAAIARRGWGLVYGGGGGGGMGALADAARAAGGHVHGVIPQGMATRELAHHRLTELDVVTSMHERKTKMYDLAGA